MSIVKPPEKAEAMVGSMPVIKGQIYQQKCNGELPIPGKGKKYIKPIA